MGEATTGVDGRKARSARTKRAIVDGCLDLVLAGDLRPTAAAIAGKANLSVRSVFQHFSDLEDLFVAVAERQTERIVALYTPEPYEGSLAARLDQFVARRVRLNEAITPTRRAAIVHEPFSPTLHRNLKMARSLNFNEVASAFESELGSADAPKQPELLEAIAALASWSTWEVLRKERGLESEAATEVLRRALSALLSAAA